MARRVFNFADDEPTAKTRRKRSQKQEERWAGKVGGRTQAGSGAVWSSKGDVKAGGSLVDDLTAFLYEQKQTTNKGFRLTTDLWAEIKQKAIKTENKQPAMQIELDIDGEDLHLVVVQEDTWLEILDMLKRDV